MTGRQGSLCTHRSQGNGCWAGRGHSAPTAPSRMGAGQGGISLHSRQALPCTATDTFLLCSSPGTLGAITLQLKVLEVSKVRLLRKSWFPSFSFLPCWEGTSPAMSPLSPRPKGVHISHAQ